MTHRNIALHPGVGNVPADRAELSPLLDHGVEEREAEEELLERLGLRAPFVIVVGDVEEGAEDVRLQSAREIHMQSKSVSVYFLSEAV